MLLVLGIAATWAGWWLVARRGASIWRVMPALYAALGILGVLVGASRSPEPRARGWYGWTDTSVVVAAGWGIASGLGLYLATRAAVAIAGRWEPFARHTAAQYELVGAVGLRAAVGLSFVVAAGEELVWRLGIQHGLGPDAAFAAGLTWAGYVAANAMSGSLPIIAGALVGGAVWGGAAWLTGGALAPLLSHVIWTTLMLVLPPGLARGKMGAS